MLPKSAEIKAFFYFKGEAFQNIHADITAK